MIRIITALFAILVSIQAANATTFFVANSIGADTNSGTTTGAPFRTIKHGLAVAGPGDTICINDNSNYTQASGEAGNGADSSVVDINTSGTPGNPITLMACNGHSPVIEHGVTNQQFYAIRVNAQWIVLGPGITVYGGSDTTTAAQCLANTGQATPCIGVGVNVANSHVVVTGMIAHHNASCGICGNPIIFGATPLHTLDYVTFTNNISYQNAWYSVSGSSGFSLYQLTNIDHNAGYHVRIEGNISWGNRMFVNETSLSNQANSHEIDGNGCILDDANHTQHSNQGPAYDGAILVENNIFAYNGSTGCHAFQTNNVDFFFNTFYHNVQSWPNLKAHNVNHFTSGNTGACDTNNTRFYNNLIISDPASGYDNIYGTGCSPHNVTLDFNMQTGGTIGFQGPHDIMSGDPKIAHPAYGNCGNWMLRAGSPALGAGDTAVSGLPATDFYGNPRPNPPSIGAAEASPLGMLDFPPTPYVGGFKLIPASMVTPKLSPAAWSFLHFFGGPQFVNDGGPALAPCN